MTKKKSEEKSKKKVCGEKMEVFSRVVGYYSPLMVWNKGKKEEFKVRKTFKLKNSNIE